MKILSLDEAIEAMYRGQSIDRRWFIDDTAERNRYNQVNSEIIFDLENMSSSYTEILKDPSKINDKDLIEKGTNTWYMPQKYIDMNIDEYVLNKCKTETEINRVKEELVLFKKNNLAIVLKFLVYLVDLMRENKIIWGVGRGSSVASFTLFLIGVHRINSLKYNLDITEFLKDK